ncbi:NUDIX hydrolase [Alkalihalophilus sp. As8PL]|uniref:NUDIX hydrolase n=1 Tax=Alkalihalophilus sp. As8PL TaxID=3237103 RepID=A0AB39BVL4_9BACI
MSHMEMVLVVSVSIIRDDEVLMIKENKSTARDKWNFPSGRIEYGEDILHAACREVKEETGYEVGLQATTGVYQFISHTNNQILLFHFTAEIIGGHLNLQEEEISDSAWVKVCDLEKCSHEGLREPKVIMQIIDNLIKEKLYSINLFNKQIL